jgi:glycosyltransferase involved in cell wall biosynthesis
MEDRILFFRTWPDPPIAKSVSEMLIKEFPDQRIEIVDIWRLIKRNKPVLFMNFFHLVSSYWIDILLRRMNPKAAYFRTPYLFNHVKELAIQKSGQPEKIAFTFQLQSIFDTSIPGIQNFIYTDHTHLANLWYSISGRVKLYSAEWIGLEKTIYSNAALIFTRSTNISKSLVEQYGIAAEKVKCVFAGTNTPAHENETANKDYSNQVVLFVGMNWKRKGGPTLVEAFKKICGKYPKATLKIIGCYPKIDHPQVKILGKLNINDLTQHYETASIFCMPSVNEPFGAVFVEAMEYALPIIATKTGAIPDMVKDGWNGYLIKPGDVDSLSSALDELLSNPDLCKKFGNNGKSQANKDYNWISAGGKIRKAILEFLKEHTS